MSSPNRLTVRGESLDIWTAGPTARSVSALPARDFGGRPATGSPRPEPVRR